MTAASPQRCDPMGCRASCESLQRTIGCLVWGVRLGFSDAPGPGEMRTVASTKPSISLTPRRVDSSMRAFNSADARPAPPNAAVTVIANSKCAIGCPPTCEQDRVGNGACRSSRCHPLTASLRPELALPTLCSRSAVETGRPKAVFAPCRHPDGRFSRPWLSLGSRSN
jgi:hypothetical protein